MLKQKLSPVATVGIVLVALMALGGFFAYTWAFSGRDRGMSMAQGMEIDKKNMQARGEKPAVAGPNAPKMAGPPSQFMKGADSKAAKK